MNICFKFDYILSLDYYLSFKHKFKLILSSINISLFSHLMGLWIKFTDLPLLNYRYLKISVLILEFQYIWPPTTFKHFILMTTFLIHLKNLEFMILLIKIHETFINLISLYQSHSHYLISFCFIS